MSERLPLALILTPTALRQSGIDWLFPQFITYQNRQPAIYTAHERNRIIAIVEDLRTGKDGRVRRDWYFGILHDTPESEDYLSRIPSIIQRKNRVNNHDLSLHLLAAFGMASKPAKNPLPQPKVDFSSILEKLKESA